MKRLACLAVSLVFASTVWASPSVDVAGLGRILVANADQALVDVPARALQRHLRRNGDGDWPIVLVDGEPQGNGILLGPTLAVRSGLLSAQDLASLHPEGYEVRLGPGRAIVAGRTASALTHGSTHLLRLMGMHWYPWRDGNEFNAVLQLPPTWSVQVPATTIRDQPWFLWRDLNNHLDLGKYGSSIRSMVLGDPQQAANPELFGPKRKDYTPFDIKGSDYVDWFHTAPYLVPRDLYYQQHPEYFAMHNGARIPPERYVRSAICETHPEVRDLSAKRMAEWMTLQSSRQIFAIAPADTDMCQCPQCLAVDVLPDYTTDRMFEWVNYVAAALPPEHRDKTLLAPAYLQTVKTPLRTRPHANVVVLYAPWFWNSRATAMHTLASPLNTIAMRELGQWITLVPEQVGIYDYPGDQALGTARRIRQYARMGIRHVYFNGPKGDLLQWLGAKLTWDPTQDVEPLMETFSRASYGPAWNAMMELETLRDRVQSVYGKHGRAVWRAIQQTGPNAPRSAFDEAQRLITTAHDAVRSSDPTTRARVRAALLGPWQDGLSAVRPEAVRTDLRCSPEQHAAMLASYRELARGLLEDCDASKAPRLATRVKREIDSFEAQMQKAQAATSPAQAAAPQELFDRTIANDDAGGSAVGPAGGVVRSAQGLRWNPLPEANQWQVDATVAGLASVTAQDDGVRITASLTRLPTVPAASLALHAGRVFASCDFAAPLPRRGEPFVYWRLHASAPAVVTLYLDHVRSDVKLHRGEQIVRIDLRNMEDAKVNAEVWPRIQGLAIDIWPQDGEYPHPPVKDVAITLQGMALGYHNLSFADIPDGGDAIWLSQFHANVPHQLPALRRAPDAFVRLRQGEAPLDRSARDAAERFRSFTEFRRLSPIRAIVATDPELSPVALAMQARLEERFGVRLPVRGDEPVDQGAVVLRKLADLGASHAREEAWLGAAGFLIDATEGRVLLAGGDVLAVAEAAARYLDDHALATEFGLTATVDPWLHELYDLDRPWFEVMPGLRRQNPLTVLERLDATVEQQAHALALADEVKRLSRQGRGAWPASLRDAMMAQPLTARLASVLWRDPMADGRELLRHWTRDHAH